MATETRATVHVGANGGTEYRLWTGEQTYRIVGKYAARPFLSPDERAKADSMEQDRRAARDAKAANDAAWRSIVFR